MKKLFLILLLSGYLAGCAGLIKAIKETTPEQVTAMQATTAPAAANIPMPYALLATPLIAILGAVAKNWWDDKHQPPKVT